LGQPGARKAAPPIHDSILDEYRKKGLAHRIGFGVKPSLLIIDFSLAFTDPSSPLGGNLDAEVRATRELLDVARRKKILTLFTTVAYQDDLSDAGLWAKKMPSLSILKAGTKMVEIDPRLQPQPAEHVITKKYASAFFGTSLASTLTSRGIDTLLITGCTTSGCVRASVVDAVQHGFRPMVVREAVGDRALPPHEASLLDIEGKYGDLVSLDEALSYLHSV
jgi:nicotinamidase-related amidase